MRQPGPVTVLYLQNGASGGAAHSLEVLVGHLDRARFRPIIWSSHDGPLVKRWRNSGVDVAIRPLHLSEGIDRYFVLGAAARDPSAWRRSVLVLLDVLRGALALPAEWRALRRLRRAEGVAFVHVNSIVLVSSGIAARVLGLPVVWHVREILAETRIGRCARWLIVRTARRIVAVSEAAARPFRSAGERIVVVSNAVDLARFDRSSDGGSVRRSLGLGDRDPVVGFVGQLFAHKGALDVVRALGLVRTRIPEVRLVIVGGTPRGSRREGPKWKRQLRARLGFGPPPDHEALLDEEIRRLGLEESVVRTGARDDVAGLLAAMDVVALPSQAEAFGRTIIETMAMSKPVVSVDAFGVGELIRHEETGLLIPFPPDVEALAASIARLLEDADLRRRLGGNARRAVVDRFSARSHAEAIMRLYQEVIEES